MSAAGQQQICRSGAACHQLWFGGAIAVLAQLPQLGMAIWLVNCINGAFSFWQEYKARKPPRRCDGSFPPLREGDMQHILAEALVPGDVFLLAEGEHISADCRVVQEAELRVDQSTLTGKVYPVRETAEAVLQADLACAELPNLVFAGTYVAAGTRSRSCRCLSNVSSPRLSGKAIFSFPMGTRCCKRTMKSWRWCMPHKLRNSQPF